MNLRRRIPRLPMAVAAVTILLMVAAACGGGDGDQDREAPAEVRQQIESVTTIPTSTPGLDREAAVIPTATATPEATKGETAVQASPTLPPYGATDQPTATPGSAVQESPDAATESTSIPATQEPTPLPAPQEIASRSEGGQVGDRAPEFEAVSNWINSEPLTMEELRGRIVLIDFWTYTCVNCIRTFPYLKEWHAKYADKGLIIVGVHSPEFDFEKVTDNVVRSAQDYDLTWPIAQDNDFGTWRAYSNRFWPAKYLVDQDGTVRYTHFGEGAYTDTEQQIRSLLSEAGADLSDVDVSDEANPKIDPKAFVADPDERITREIYGGYGRNSQGAYIFHQEYYVAPDQTLFYTDPGDHQNQFMYLQGSWTNGRENLRHARQTEDYEDYIALKFVATSVNAVIDPEGGEPFEVQVTIDGRPLLISEAGADLVIEDGRSFFRVDEARLYEVVALPEFTGHELVLSSNSPDFSFFAFTFGAYSEGP